MVRTGGRTMYGTDGWTGYGTDGWTGYDTYGRTGTKRVQYDRVTQDTVLCMYMTGY